VLPSSAWDKKWSKSIWLNVSIVESLDTWWMN
jgi:hypothetical protein